MSYNQLAILPPHAKQSWLRPFACITVGMILGITVAKFTISQSEVVSNNDVLMYKQTPTFGTKIGSNICPYLSSLCTSAPSEKWTVFPKHSSGKTVSFEEQIMSKDKYPSIFSTWRLLCFFILKIFFTTYTVFKIEECQLYIPQV